MWSPEILAAAVLNGLMSGAVYALIAVGLTLVYGVLHIINFAHGAMLSAAMFAAYLAFQAGIDPYVAMAPLAALFFGRGYGLVAVMLWGLLALTDTGKAIRAVAKEKLGAALAGIDVAHIYAVTFGLGAGCLAIAACLLLPTYYVHPRVGNAYVLVAFTIVVL